MADPTGTGWTDRGAVTAELAVVMPAVTVVLAVALSLTQAVLAQVSCVDAARAAARAAARGDDLTAVRRTARDAAAGAGVAAGATTVAVAVAGETVTVTVSRPVHLLAVGPAVRVTARAVAQREVSSGGVP